MQLSAQQQKWVVSIVIAILVAVPFFQYRAVFLTPTDIYLYESKYSTSQYVMGEASPEKIDDDTLYVYAGFVQARGDDPTSINFEHPPLMKYLFGWSYTLTGNSYWISLVLYALLLITFFWSTNIVIKDFWFRIVAVVLLAALPAMSITASRALLDMPLVLMVLATVGVLHRDFANNWLKYSIVGLLVGLAAGIKYPIPFIGLTLACIGLVAWYKKELTYLLIVPVTAAVAYLVQYTRYFMNGHGIAEWISFERYRFNWFISGRSDSPKNLIFSTLFTGQYKKWYADGYVMSQDWTVLLPAVFTAQLAAVPWVKKNFWLALLLGYATLALIFFAVAKASDLRYLIQIIPFWILVAVAGIERLYNHVYKK